MSKLQDLLTNPRWIFAKDGIRSATIIAGEGFICELNLNDGVIQTIMGGGSPEAVIEKAWDWANAKWPEVEK